MKMRNFLLLAVLCTYLSLSAQQITGNIRGTVTDATGAVVQSATVIAQQAETAFSRSAITGRNGNYVLLELPVGHYRLQISATGFQQYVREGIALDVNGVLGPVDPGSMNLISPSGAKFRVRGKLQSLISPTAACPTVRECPQFGP